MSFYRDAETFAEVMEDVFGRVLAEPQLARQLQESRNVLRIAITQPPYLLVVDARSRPVRYLSSEAGVRVDTAIRLDAETLHNVWLGKTRLRDAYASGKVKVEGNSLAAIPRLLRFADLFRAAERVYPIVLRERGLL